MGEKVENMMPPYAAANRGIATISWKRAAGLALLVVYGPFFLMATYALLFESSSYCKRYAWTLLPFGPGLLPVELGRRTLDLPRLEDALSFALAFIVSSAVVYFLAWLIRKGRWIRYGSMAVATAFFSFSAIGLLALLRS